MKLAVFHYHVRPGGVTGVVTQACIALGRHTRTVDEVTLVTGTAENTEEVVARIGAGAPELPVSVRVHPELGYVSEQSVDSMSALEDRIAAILRENYLSDDILWWVHNYQLGKNPAFTAALVNLLETEPGQRAVLQIHDFPECARFENLAELRAHVSAPVYPVLPNVAYATINYRDRRLLVEAGVPEDAVTALPNPVPARESTAPRGGDAGGGTRSGGDIPGGRGTPRGASGGGPPDRGEVNRRLAATFAGRFPAFEPEGLLILYPIRAIRRKNVMEAGFITRLLNTDLDTSANLMVTLPGTSPLEKPYSDMVEAAFEDGVIPGMAGIGNDLEQAGLSFDDLARTADLVVSTSVQEGFGYAFFEAPQRGVPLLARYLDVLDGLDHLFSEAPHAFYRELRVPFESPSINSIRTLLRIRYDEYLERSTQSMPAAAREQVEAEVEEMLSGPTVDFSYLMPQMQYAYAKDLGDEGFANEVRALNFELLGSLVHLLGHATGPSTRPAGPGEDDGIDRELGYATYASRVDTLVSRLAERARSGNGSHGGGHVDYTGERAREQNDWDPVQRRLVEAFAHRDYFRLLYGAVGE